MCRCEPVISQASEFLPGLLPCSYSALDANKLDPHLREEVQHLSASGPLNPSSPAS